MAGKSKRMASNPGQMLKNHQEFIGKIGKREPGRRQHSCSATLGIPDAAILFKRAEEVTICIVR